MSSFPTSDELYRSIKHDPYIFRHKVKIGHLDKIKNKIRYTEYNKFKPVDLGGDIPFSRVYIFTYDDEIIWDREKRLYSLNDIREKNKNLKKITDDPFTIISYNILNNEQNKSNKISFPNREKGILEFIKTCNYDFIFLQEVPIYFIQKLKDIRDYNLVSTENEKDIFNHLVIMSKFDIIDSDIFYLNKTKCFLICDIYNELMQNIRFINVHLTSNLQKDSSSKRLEQFLEIKKRSLGLPTLIAGDFNDSSIIVTEDFTDSLSQYDDKSKFNTYDPINNDLAKLNIASKIPVAYDKILSSKQFKVSELKVLSNIMLSDHFPLTAKIELNMIDDLEIANINSKKEARNIKTALCIVIPFEFWNLLGYDIGKWMPHVSIFLGFVNESDFFIIEKKIEKIVNKYLPIKIQFTNPTLFIHEEQCTVVLETDKDSKNILQNMYDEIKISLNINEKPLNPHLSIEKCRTIEDGEKLIRKIGNSLNFSFECKKLCMVSREKTDHLVVLNTVGNNDLICTKNTIDNIIKKYSSELRLMGSSVLNPYIISSDIDLQIVTTNIEKLIRSLETCGEVILLKLMTSDHNKYIRIYTKIDLSYDIHIEEKLRITEMHYVLDKIEKLNKKNLLINCVDKIKKDFKRCGIYGPKYGFIIGFGVCAMILKLISDNKLKNEDELYDVFIKEYSIETLPLSIIFSKKDYEDSCKSRGYDYPSSKFIIIQNLCPPYDNILRNITKSSSYKILETIKLGFDENKIKEKFKDLNKNTKILINSNTFKEIDDILNWITTIFIKIILNLEKSHSIILHDNEWKKKDSDDYIFSYEFNFFAINSLASRNDLFGELQNKFYKLFPTSNIQIIYK